MLLYLCHCHSVHLPEKLSNQRTDPTRPVQALTNALAVLHDLPASKTIAMIQGIQRKPNARTMRIPQHDLDNTITADY